MKVALAEGIMCGQSGSSSSLPSSEVQPNSEKDGLIFSTSQRAIQNEDRDVGLNVYEGEKEMKMISVKSSEPENLPAEANHEVGGDETKETKPVTPEELPPPEKRNKMSGAATADTEEKSLPESAFAKCQLELTRMELPHAPPSVAKATVPLVSELPYADAAPLPELTTKADPKNDLTTAPFHQKEHSEANKAAVAEKSPVNIAPSFKSLPSLKEPKLDIPSGRNDNFQLKTIPVDECPPELTMLVAELRYERIIQNCSSSKYTLIGNGEGTLPFYQKYESAESLRLAFEEKDLGKIIDKRLKHCFQVYQECWLEPYLLEVGTMSRNAILLVDFSSMLLGDNGEDLCNVKTTEGSQAFNLTGKPFEEARLGSKKFVKMNRGHFMYSDLGFGYGYGDVQAVEATKNDALHKVCPAIENIQRVVGTIMKQYGGSQIIGEDGTTPYRCTIMHTLQEFFQSPHVDYSSSDIITRKRRALGSNRNDDGQDEVPMPWSADFPIKEGGLRLNFWHDYDPNFYGHAEGMQVPANNRAITLSVPLKYLVMWRADIVHSGGLDNDQRTGATRIHMYLPATQHQASGIYGRTGTIQTEPYSGFLYPRDQMCVGRERRYCGKRKRPRSTKMSSQVVEHNTTKTRRAATTLTKMTGENGGNKCRMLLPSSDLGMIKQHPTRRG